MVKRKYITKIDIKSFFKSIEPKDTTEPRYKVYEYKFWIFRKPVSFAISRSAALTLMHHYRDWPHKWYITYYIHRFD